MAITGPEIGLIGQNFLCRLYTMYTYALSTFSQSLISIDFHAILPSGRIYNFPKVIQEMGTNYCNGKKSNYTSVVEICY